MRLDPSLTPRRADDLEIRAVPDGYVVYDPSRDRLHFLNGTATFVLECCDGATPVGELPTLFAAAFRLDEDPAAAVAACLERLAAEGLLAGLPADDRSPV
ncbi:MAG TPA: PqqD family protein [Casimicrobiaceae bacterium]|jgi:hypothetical protein|nr:PqqD family protein [Casimicrobiaceae bacterium]